MHCATGQAGLTPFVSLRPNNPALETVTALELGPITAPETRRMRALVLNMFFSCMGGP